MPVVQCVDYGDKAGFVVLWQGIVKVGDNFEPEVYDYEVEFDLGDDVREGCFGYLSMMTYDVDYTYNKLYINGTYVGTLHDYDKSEWRVDTFRVPTGAVKKGKNIFKLTARNKSGGYTGQVDDFKVQDPLLIYAVK